MGEGIEYDQPPHGKYHIISPPGSHTRQPGWEAGRHKAGVGRLGVGSVHPTLIRLSCAGNILPKSLSQD